MDTITRLLLVAESDDDTVTFQPMTYVGEGDALILTRKKWDSLGQPTTARVTLVFEGGVKAGQNSDPMGATA